MIEIGSHCLPSFGNLPSHGKAAQNRVLRRGLHAPATRPKATRAGNLLSSFAIA
jgi:hypothetical protein